MSRRITLVLCIFLGLTACSSHKPTIEKQNSVPQNPDDDPTIIQKKDGEEQDTFIEFSLSDEQVRINLSMVPILDDYMEAAAFPEEAIKEMKLERVQHTDKKLYILSFSCNEDLCSYLMLDRTHDTNDAMLLADIASLVQIKPSPDDTKLLVEFERKTDALPLPLTDIMVIDTENWQQLELENETNNTELLKFTWPLIRVEWSDNEHVTVSKPNIKEPTEDQLTDWQETEQGKTNLSLKITGIK